MYKNRGDALMCNGHSGPHVKEAIRIRQGREALVERGKVPLRRRCSGSCFGIRRGWLLDYFLLSDFWSLRHWERLQLFASVGVVMEDDVAAALPDVRSESSQACCGRK